MSNWSQHKIFDRDGTGYRLVICSRWNTSYFTRHMDGESYFNMVGVLEQCVHRNGERHDDNGCDHAFAYQIQDKVITIFDNSNIDERFHGGLQSSDLTELVFQRLREGIPKPPKPPEPVWVAPSDVWSV